MHDHHVLRFACFCVFGKASKNLGAARRLKLFTFAFCLHDIVLNACVKHLLPFHAVTVLVYSKLPTPHAC